MDIATGLIAVGADVVAVAEVVVRTSAIRSGVICYQAAGEEI